MPSSAESMGTDDRGDLSHGHPTTAAEPVRLGRDVLEQLYREAVDRAGLALVLLTPDGQVLEASDAMGELMGRPSAELVGAHIGELLTDLPEVGDEFDTRPMPVEDLDGLLSRVAHPDSPVGGVEMRLTPLRGVDDEPVLYAAWMQKVQDDNNVASLVGFSAAMAELRHSSTHDPLTDVFNRSTILDRLGELAGRATGAAFLVDIDGFRALNDTLSQHHGDEVLRVVADRLALSLREDAEVGRSGADEFLVLVPGVDHSEQAENLAGRLCHVVAELHTESLLAHRTTVSIGAAMCRAGATAEELLLDAQVALHHARRQGPGRYRVSDEELRRHRAHGDVMSNELQMAVDSEQIATWYQPVVDLITAECVGWEALARWILLDGTVRPAGEFMESAERSGSINDLGHIVARDAVRRATRAPAGAVISINLAPGQLDDDLLDALTRLRDRYGSGPAHLAIEMDPAGLLSLDGHAARLLQRARDQGILLQAHNLTLDDDIGTTIGRFPLAAAKLDRSVTRDLRHGRAPRALLDRITDLAATLRVSGIRPVAEGVEDNVQAQVLRDAGWRYGQGYLFGPPAPATGGRLPRSRNPLGLPVG